MNRLAFVCVLLLAIPAISLDVGPDDVYIRVVDVGSGLCTVTETPDKHYMVFDAGNGHRLANDCIEAVREIVDQGKAIDLLVVSHSDADHLYNADEVLNEFDVETILRTGYVRERVNWKNWDTAVGQETGATVHNLTKSPLAPGTVFTLGNDVKVTYIAGWPQWIGEGPTDSELRNAISIVVKLEYHGGSVLFTGDTVGRRKSDPDDACRDAEEWMVHLEAAGLVSLASKVIIAPHHGGNNGSSACFIAAVDPLFVIFSSGHEYGHPTLGAASRYLDYGVRSFRMFRTDRSDDENSQVEWKLGSQQGCHDRAGDDDVEIVIRANGWVDVDYRSADAPCQ